MKQKRLCSRATAFTALAMLGSSAGCSHANAPPPAIAATVPTPAKAQAPTPAAPHDVTAVRRPQNVSLVVRLPHPEPSRKVLAQLLGSVFPVVQSLTLERAVGTFMSDTLAEVLDFNQPIDAVLSVESLAKNKEFAVSAAIASFEDAKKELAEDFRLTTQSDGVIALTPTASAGATLLTAHCALFPAFGPSPYRLVCAGNDRMLRTAGPYLARTVTRQPVSGDVYLDLETEGLAESFHSQIDLDDPDKMGDTMGRLLALQPMSAVSHISLDAKLDPASAELTLTTHLKTRESPVVRAGLALARDPHPLPDVFWRIPADADLAIYSHGVSREDYGEVRTILGDALRKSLESDNASAVAIERSLRIYDDTFFTGGPVLFAHGFDVDEAQRALDQGAPQTLAQKQAEQRALSGWMLFELDEPAARWIGAYHEMLAIDKLPHDSKTLAPKKKEEKPSKTKTTWVERPVAPSARLPAGSLHVEFRTTPRESALKEATDDEPAPFAHTNHGYIVPDAGRTWMAFGANDALVLAKLHTVLGRADAGKTLAQREGLEALHTSPTNLGGFVTIGGIAAMGLPWSPPQRHERGEARKYAERIEKLDHKGTTPIPFLLGGIAHDRSEGAGEISFRVVLSKDALGEWVTLVK